MVDVGEDPMGERAAERAAKTVGDLYDRFEEEHGPKLRPGTRKEYQAMIVHDIRPALGCLKVVHYLPTR